MANGSSQVRDLLKDVELNGVVVILKKKLLWMLGWSQDRAGAWKDLLSNWEELGLKRDLLHGVAVYDRIVLIANTDNNTLDRVSDWATGE
jgi:hypothetical protein